MPKTPSIGHTMTTCSDIRLSIGVHSMPVKMPVLIALQTFYLFSLSNTSTFVVCKSSPKLNTSST